MMELKCLQCIGEHNEAVKKGYPKESLPPINDAITLAPSWVSQMLMGQMAMTCVAIPACMDHLETKEKSAVERAAGSGLIIGGGG
jgi:hypothetical protein